MRMAEKIRGRRHLRRGTNAAAAVILAVALGACQTIGSSPATNPAAGSQTNIQSLTDVIDNNPQDPNGYNIRGIAYAEAGRTREALSDFDRAIELNPQFYQAYANRGLVERNQGRYSDALVDYNRALQINPNYAIAYAGRGLSYQAQGQTELALADFNQALSLDPADSRTYYSRGLIYKAQGQDELAIADFTSAISFQPRVYEPYYARGEVYLARGAYSSAFDDFFQVIQNVASTADAAGTLAEAWTLLGQALEGQDDLETAYIAYSNALTIDPTYQAALAGQARTAAYAPVPQAV
jgi:tetratricopeptide (TPR) repeat protein